MNRVSTGELARINQEMAKAVADVAKKRREQEEQRKKYEEERQRAALEQSRIPNSGGSAWEQYRAAKAAGEVRNASEFIQKRDARNAAWNKVGAETLNDDMEALAKSISSTYGTQFDPSKYYSQETINGSSDQVKKMRDRLNALAEYYNAYGGSDDQKKAVGEQIKAYDSELKFLSDLGAHYGQYKNEADFNYRTDKRRDEDYIVNNYDAEAGKKNLAELKGYLDRINTSSDSLSTGQLVSNARSGKKAYNRTAINEAKQQYGLDGMTDDEVLNWLTQEYQLESFALNNVDRMRTAAGYRNLANNEDFLQGVISGKAVENPTFEDYLNYENAATQERAEAYKKRKASDPLIFAQDTRIPDAPSIVNKLKFYEDLTNDKYGNKTDSTTVWSSDLGAAKRDALGYHYGLMTDDEKRVYYYLLGTQGKEAADKYLEDMDVTLDYRNTEEVKQFVRDLKNSKIFGNVSAAALANTFGGLGGAALGYLIADSNEGINKTAGDIAYSAASVPANVIGGGISTVGEIGQRLSLASKGDWEGKGYNPYENYNLFSVAGREARGLVAKDIEDKIGWEMFGQNVMSQVYQSLMSGADSAFGMATLGRLYTISMGGSAAASKAAELYESGASSSQIYWESLLSGIAEATFEYLSIENLSSIKSIVESKPTTLKKAIKMILTQNGVEASEEVFTEIANMVIDKGIKKYDSDYDRKVTEYVRDGMTREEAVTKAAAEVAADIGWAGAGGFISGFASSTLTISGAYRAGKENADAQISAIDPGNAEGLYNNAKKIDYSILNDASEALKKGDAKAAAEIISEGKDWYEYLKSYAKEKYGKNQASEISANIDASIDNLNQIKNLISSGNINADSIQAVLEKAKSAQDTKVDVTSANDEKLFSLLAKGEPSNSVIEKNILKDRGTLAAFERLTGLRIGGTTVSQKRADVREAFKAVSSSTETLKAAQNAIESGATATEGHKNAAVIIDQAIQANRAENSRLRNSEKVKSAETKAAIDATNRQHRFLETVRNYVINGGDLSGFTESPVADVPGDGGTNSSEAKTTQETAKKRVRADFSAYQNEKYSAENASALANLNSKAEQDAFFRNENAGIEREIKNIESSDSITAEEKAQRIGELKEAASRNNSLAKAMDDFREMGRLVRAGEVDKIVDSLRKPLKKMGVNIEVVDNVEAADGMKSGAYFDKSTNTIKVSRDWNGVENVVKLELAADGNGFVLNPGKGVSFDRAVTQTIAHEIAHADSGLTLDFIKAVAGTQYDAFDLKGRLEHPDDRSWKSENAQKEENWRRYVDAYTEQAMLEMKGTEEQRRASAEKVVNDAYIFEEIMADMFGAAVDDMGHSSRAGENIFWAMNRNKPGIIKRILNALERFIAKIDDLIHKDKGAYLVAEQRQAAERLRDMLTGELKRAYGTDVKSEAAGESGGGNRYSISKSFVKNYDAWDKQSVGGYFKLGTTSAALESVGINPANIYWYKSKIKEIRAKHPEMTDAVIKQVPELLENPIIIMQSQTVTNRATVLGDLDAGGKPVLCALELKPDGNISNFIVIASAYPKSAVQNLINTSDILYVDPNKNRTDSWLSSRGLQLPEGVTNYGSIGSISYTEKNVKGQIVFGEEKNAKTAMQEALERAGVTKEEKRFSLASSADTVAELQREETELTNRIREIEKSDAFKKANDDLSKAINSDNIAEGMKAYQAWRKESGYADLVDRRDALRADIEKSSESGSGRASAGELAAIEKSGLSEADYFRKQAVNEFGYTPYFYDAGYIVPNGKMLNFSGEKGQHYGSRGEDHRAIDAIYENTKGTDALVRFMNDGNIRIMAETPGLDISASTEPSKEQYTTIRRFANEFSDGGYFAVDLSDENGKTVGTLEYEGNINPTRIVNDIKHFYETGEVREQSGLDRFRYSLTRANDEYMKAVESGNTEEQQRLVDKAAEEWSDGKEVYVTDNETGEAIFKFYRSADGGRTVWDGNGHNQNKGVFLTSNEYIADAFNYGRGDTSVKHITVYAKAENPFRIDAKNNLYTSIPVDESMPEWLQDRASYDTAWSDSENDYIIEQSIDIDNLYPEAFKHGYDAVIVENVKEGVGGGVAADVVLKDGGKQMKSADPITYDDSGNVIPLTERFDSGNRDIRWSLAGNSGITTEITDDSYDEYEGGYQRRDIKLNGETVGTVAIRIYDDYSEIDRIDIDEKYRNKGIGTTVLGDIAGEFDTTYIVPDNENAKRLYERIGEEVTSGEVYENLDQGYGVYRLDKSYGNTRWSLSGTTDGRPVAVIDKDILDGVPESEWKSVARKAISEGFPDGIAVQGKNIRVNQTTRREYTKSDYTQWLFNHSKGVFADKMRAAAKLDDVVLAATNWTKDGGLKHPRKDNFVDFGRGNVLMSIGGNKYSAEVILAYPQVGAPVLYDVVTLNPDSFDLINEKTASANANAATSGAHTTRFSSDISAPNTVSLTQNTPDVNSQYMREGEKDSSSERHSLVKSAQSELKALQKENEKLRQDVDDLKQELQLTHGRKLSRDALISSIQKILIDGYGVKLSAKELYPDVTNLYDMFYNNTVDGKRLKKGESVDTMRIIEEMDKIVDAVIENAVGVDDTYVEMKKLLPELRNTKLVVPMDARADAAQSAGFENWAEFRKANFGRVGFANEGLPVDTYYMELSERYPELFPDGITNPGEQAAHIADVVNTIRESGITEYQLYDIEDERVRTSIKNDVMDIIGNAEKLQTFADRAAQKVEDTKLAEAMHYGADIAKLKRLNTEKVAGIKAENRKRLSDMRRKYQDRVTSVREKYAEARANRSEKQKQTVLRNKILRKYTEASSKLYRPTTENHFTEAMRKPLMEFLAAVDITTGKSVAKQEVYDRILSVIKAANNMAAEGGKNGLDIAETDLNVQEKQLIINSGMLERMSAWVEANQGKKLTELSSAQLEELNGIFNQLNHLTAEIKRLYDPREGLAAKSWQAQKEIGLAQTKEREQVLGAKTEKAREKYEQIHFGALDAAGYYNTLGSDTMTAQFERFRQCQNRFSENIQMFTDRLGEIVDGAIPKDEHGKNAKEVTLKLSRGTLTATPAQLMSIHLMLNQEDSRRCLFNEAGGVIIGKFTAEKPKDGKTHITKKRTFAQSGKLVLNEADAAKITAALTDGQRKRADAISALLNNEAARLGNEVSMAMYGYKKYTTENYFPMRTVDDYRAIADNPNYEMNLLGLSFTKERTGRAGKALVAEDIYDVIGRHLTNMAQYNAFAQELDNAKKMYSLRLGDGTSLKQRIIRSYGREADAFYNKLINNLSGVQMYTNNSAEALSDKLLSNYKAAAVAGNVSVVLKQPMSIFRALPEFSLAGLKKSMAFEDILNLSPKQLKANTAEMLKYSGIARLKAWGSSENMTRKSFESLYNDNSDTARQKINEFLTSGAENADMWTWAKLWRMSKAEIDAQGKYTAGSKEYFEAVDRKFSDVIGKTQVVQSALDSSMAVQNAKGFGKFLFAFQNEPLKQYSYLISTLNDARRGKPGAKKKLAKVIASSLANTAAVSAISTFMAWLRGTLDRDDDDELLDDLMKEFAGNSIDDLLSGAFAPVWQYIDTIIGAINSGVYGNTVERLDMAALTDLGGLINKYVISRNGGRPNLGTVQDIVNVASNLFGLPAKNIFRDVKSVVDRIILELPVPSAAKYNYLKAWKDVELTNKAAVTEAYYDVLRDAVDRGRYSDYVKIKRDMIYHGYTETKIKNAVMKSSLMDDLYELKKVNPGSYKAKVNSIVSSVSAVSSLEGKEFEDFIESAMKRREREDGGSKTDDEVYDEMHRKMEKEVKEQLIYIDVSKRAAYIKKMLKTYGEYGITEADILKVLRKAGKA